MAHDESVARVHLAWNQDYRFVATFPDLPRAAALALDEAPPLGSGAGPNPAALLAAAVGTCLAASLTFCLRKSRADIAGLTADVTAHVVRNEAGRLRIGSLDVVLSPAVGREHQHQLTRCEGLFEDFCIVTESIRHGIPVNVTTAPIQRIAADGVPSA